ncbi:MAG: hypothetical protein RQ753_10380, partial [Desulfurivibrionaceae bacterium]|nr:hypothetical protein [Desulfurivibrionaceae bacterium]
MKGGIEIIIKPDGFVLTAGRGSLIEELSPDEADVGVALASFAKDHDLRGGTVNLFLAEELVYTATFDLPASTPHLGDAVRFQLGMLAPFPEQDILSGYVAARDGDSYRVTISAARAGQVISVVEQLIRAGFVVKGIYPESQRYLTGKWRKLRWALVMPGRLAKIFIFDDSRLVDRLLSKDDDLRYDELTKACATENIFHRNPPSGEKFKPIQMLLAAAPLLKDYNMLPASYRRRDYLKIAIVALAVLNLVGLIALGGFRFVEQAARIDKADREIARLEPLVHEVIETKKRIRQTEDFLDLVGQLKGNPDIFPFLENLTRTLPEGSYLNQLRINVSEGTAV